MKNIILTAVVLSALVSCGPSIRVASDYDKELKMASYKTFSWLDIKSIEQKGSDPRYFNELTDKRIKGAVSKEMESRGLLKVTGKGDIELHYHIIIDDKTMLIAEPIGSRYSNYLNKSRTISYQYKEGTLIIDMMDVKTNELVWRGWATDVITEKAEKKPEESINMAVKEILKNLPAN